MERRPGTHPGAGYRPGMYVETVVQINDRDTYQAIVRLRKMEKHHRDEADALLEVYRTALGLA